MDKGEVKGIRLKRFYLPNYLYFVTSVTQNKRKIFSDESNIRILLESLDLYRKKYSYKVIAYCVLPDHFHALIMPSEKANISKIMKGVKGYSSKQINSKKNWEGRIWQHQFLDHVITRNEDYKAHIDYIHNNPLKHNLVENLDDHRWSSYRNYFLEDDTVFKIDKMVL